MTFSRSKRARYDRRRAMRLGYVNGALWAAGNGLTSGTVIYYLAIELGAAGMGISLILAAPAVAGLLRLAAPPIIRFVGGAKSACLRISTIAYVLLFALAPLLWPVNIQPGTALKLLVAVLCLHQLLEYIATVALWAWLAEIVPPRIRGRYFARRQIWQLAVLIPTLLGSGWFVDAWRTAHAYQSDRLLLGYVACVALGAGLLLASLAPLLRMPDVGLAGVQGQQRGLRELAAPFRSAHFRRLLVFGSWFSFFNGVTGTAQTIFPYAVLGLGVFSLSVMRTTMRVGQIALSPTVGRYSDRWGNLPVLVVCQIAVATGPLFFLLADAERWWLLFGAWLVWSAYVGLNVCLPNLMLKLAPPEDNAPYIATYFGVTTAVYAASTVLGGVAFNVLYGVGPIYLGPWALNRYEYLFLFGWITRSMGLLFLLRVIEPGRAP